MNAWPATVASDDVTPGRTAPLALLRACRPRQWAKNALVLAAPLAAGVIARDDVAHEVVAGALALCLLSSATYLLNDVRDREQDRRHPRKRLRPIAAGELSVAGAVRWAAILAVAGLATAAAVRPLLALIGLGYLALTTSYSLWWRRVVVADIVVVAAGFVVRACAGGAAADVPLSRWFLLVTSACAFFLVAGKRYAELIDQGRDATRRTLNRYSPGGLTLLLAGAVGLAVVAYAMWSFQRPETGPWYELSLLPFVAWLARYGVLLRSGAGQAPEEVILRDGQLLLWSALWLALFLGGTYVGR